MSEEKTVHYKSYEECLKDAKKNGLALQYIPDAMKTGELCYIADQKNWNALNKVA